MDTWRVVMMTSAAILILVGLLGSLIMWAWRRSARIRESERLNKLELTIINALERSGYKMYGGLKLRADPVNKTFTLVGRYASQTFHVDKVDSDFDDDESSAASQYRHRPFCWSSGRDRCHCRD